MAQYGDEQQYRREVTHTDEHGNPIRKEYENVAQSDTGIQYEREGRHTTDEYGNPKIDYGGQLNRGTAGHQGLGTNATRGTDRTGTHGIGSHQGLGGHAKGGTGTDNASGGRSVGQTGYQGLGTERGSATATGGAGMDYTTSGGRSVGQTGYQGLGTERGTGGTTGFYQNQPSATPMGGGGIGTGTKDVYGGTDNGSGRTEKKGTMEKIKEKLPGHH